MASNPHIEKLLEKYKDCDNFESFRKRVVELVESDNALNELKEAGIPLENAIEEMSWYTSQFKELGDIINAPSLFPAPIIDVAEFKQSARNTIEEFIEKYGIVYIRVVDLYQSLFDLAVVDLKESLFCDHKLSELFSQRVKEIHATDTFDLSDACIDAIVSIVLETINSDPFEILALGIEQYGQNNEVKSEYITIKVKSSYFHDVAESVGIPRSKTQNLMLFATKSRMKIDCHGEYMDILKHGDLEKHVLSVSLDITRKGITLKILEFISKNFNLKCLNTI